MEVEENIYNLLPAEEAKAEKKDRYISKHKNNLIPTFSTFVAQKKAVGGMGKPKGTDRPQSSNFLKKGIGGGSGAPSLKNSQAIRPSSAKENNEVNKYKDPNRKAAVPKKDDKPLMGLKSNKNFISQNGIDVILKAPKENKDPTEYVKKKEYGQVPEYLKSIKQQVYDDKKALSLMRHEHERDKEKERLSPAEVEKILEGYQNKWNDLNREYLKLCHFAVVGMDDTKRRKKEAFEKELQEVEKAIEKLKKSHVYIDPKKKPVTNKI